MAQRGVTEGAPGLRKASIEAGNDLLVDKTLRGSDNAALLQFWLRFELSNQVILNYPIESRVAFVAESQLAL